MAMFPLTHEGRVDDFPRFREELAKLWSSGVLQEALRDCSSVVDYSIRFFMSQLDRVCAPDYVPTAEDILNVKTKTVGIIETDFVFKTMRIRMVDVGGQKNERRKWIHAFQEVTAVVFIVALTDFDQLLEEDGKVRERESSNCFLLLKRLFARRIECRTAFFYSAR
jgi:hypothetical protein